MRFYAPIAKVDAGTHMVWGYASTEAADDQGEIVTRAALAGALGDYMKFANIREMHRMSAVGVAEEASVDDRGLHVGARIVDPGAWEKVREGVYKGFSIGGRVKTRDPGDRRVITGLSLTEISLVDRPANPEAVFDCWKSDGGEDMARSETADLPVQVWDCGVGEHRHRTKADALQCLDRDAAPPRLPAGEASAPFDGKAALDGKAVQRLREAVERLESCLKMLTEGDLAKSLAGALLPRLDALARRVDEIAATPLPPQTLARGLTAIAKGEDGGRSAAAPDDVVAALAQMSDEERTLALIKVAHANPVRPGGVAMR